MGDAIAMPDSVTPLKSPDGPFPAASPILAAPVTDFEILLRLVLGPALGAALRLTRSRPDAEDLVQEASLNAFRAFATFRPGTNFKAWFFKIMMNCWYAAHRRSRPSEPIQDVEDAHELFLYERAADAGYLRAEDPAKATIGRMTAEDIACALDALPEEYKVVCTMYFIEDFAYQEIADMLGVPVGTVRSRLHRGRKMLQKRLWMIAADQGIVPAAAPRPSDEVV
jgi:RNA polymerase sigma-70 factor (ECF subfamily)